MREAPQRQDEEDAGDEIEEGGEIGALMRGPQPFFLYMPSMRWVTRKPPKMLTLAKRQRHEAEDARAQTGSRLRRPPGARRRQQRADDDHRRDGVGDRHQRRVQRRRHAPDHVVADEDRQHEDGEAEHGRIDGAAGGAASAWPSACGGLGQHRPARRPRPPGRVGGGLRPRRVRQASDCAIRQPPRGLGALGQRSSDARPRRRG